MVVHYQQMLDVHLREINCNCMHILFRESYFISIYYLYIIHNKDSRIQGFKSIYLQQPIHYATVLINNTYSTITRQIEITNNH